MDDVPELIASIAAVSAALAWPLLAAILSWHVWPVARRVIESRGLTLKFGDFELTVQQASDQLRKQVEDLQRQVAPLVAEGAAPAATAQSKNRGKRLLWVDDRPLNNAYEISRLAELGVAVDVAKSTSEAIERLSKIPKPDIIISDMDRREEGVDKRQAGIDLIEALKTKGYAIPVIIYSSPKSLSLASKVTASGGKGITSSPIELFRLMATAGIET